MNANELLAELEKVAVRSDKGTFVSMDDVRRLTQDRKEEAAEAEAKPKPRNFNQAKVAARADEALAKRFPKPVPHLGGMGDPQPSSRT